ncbi:Vitamin B12 transporter BtuB precursor [Vibrio aerogenes CECT 7868]|uniref:Vitamin B12 transporter BtuB n=1 Tax=Vibrio aerogenes CECT 7868 TaxID=1216006 RepID=A0A1M6F0B7_9VIBR|nr:TonB-dependent vitamin B12 receptor [Vibrio aerogenes]SHI91086.1 Vitamin B12 transporter BtuB precursor [Vibrio aerogenes CECT 7868]
MNKTCLAIAVASLFSYVGSTYADEPVIVSANRYEQSAGTTLADVELITREDIETTQAKSLPQLLRRLVGIQVFQNGGRGQNASLSVRGTSSSQVLVLVDGVRFARAAKGAVDFNQIPLNYIRRIEYIRGARASLYGSEAIGGVINIITIARSEHEVKEVNVGLGSLDYKEINAIAGLQTTEKSQLNLAAGHESTDGYNVHPLTGVNDNDKHGFKSSHGLIGYVHQVNDHIQLFSHARMYQNTYQYDGSFSSFHSLKESEKKDYAVTLGGNFEQEQFHSSLMMNTQRQRGWNYTQSTGKDSGTKDKVHQQNIQWNSHYELNPATVVGGGIDWRNESYSDINNSNRFDRENFAAYGFGSYQKEKLLLEASLRGDHNQEFGGRATYNLGAGYQFIPEFGLKLNYGTAFKAPNLYQQYDPTYGETNLKSEKSKNAEISFEGDIQGIGWSVSAYNYKIDNLIDYNPSTFVYMNVDGETNIKGVEFTSEFNTGIIQHQISAEYKHAEDENGQQLQRRAKEMYKWNALISFSQLDWSVSYQFVGERPDVDYSSYPYNNIVLGGYSLVDTAVSYYASESVTINARIDNLFDKEYETAKGYVSPERAYYLNIRYQF